MADIIVAPLEERHFDKWSELVSTSEEGSVYSLPAYLEVLCRATGGRFQVLGAMRGEELVGGVATYEERHPYGDALTNRPLLYYNGVVLRSYDTRYPSEVVSRRIAAMYALAGHLSRTAHARVILHNRAVLDVRPFVAHGWTARPAYSYVVPIDDLRAAWDRVAQNLRRLITRAEQHGITVSDDEDFDAFFALHNQVHERKDAPLYLPKQAFQAYFAELHARGLCRLFLARMPDGRAVAGQLVLLGAHAVSHTVCAGSDAATMNLGTTPFLRWKAFERLSALGYRANDLTDAALNSVTRFKSQLGGTLVTNMVVVRPPALRYRVHQGWRQGRIRAQMLAMGAARRVLGRRS